MRSRTTSGALVLLLMLALMSSAQTVDPGAPAWRNDPSWPRPFPNNWVIGQIGGLFVDRQDHIWVLQRPVTTRRDANGRDIEIPAASRTPAVLEFDGAGNILSSWGGKGYVPDWPVSEHGLWVDRNGNVWLGGNAPGDRQVLKFTHDGKQLLEIGHPTLAPRDNHDTTMLGQPAGIEVDDSAHEVYIADGYLNNRIVVYDSDSGRFKRGWGAYGIALGHIVNAPEPTGAEASTATRYVREKPDYVPGEPAETQFRTPVHCVRLSADGFVYVCDRRNDRIQVFTKQGRFIREFHVHPETLANGSVWMLSFSRDPGQKYLLIADGINQQIWVLRRSDGVEVSSFAQGFLHTVHEAGLDSKGNYYTGDVGGAARSGGPIAGNGLSIQKFVIQAGN
jgi:hypothetical protein